MAKCELQLPNELIKEFEQLNKKSDEMFEEMTKAGAEVVYSNVKSNIPSSWRDSDIMNCLVISKTYKTPSDDGVNTKVMFSGYFKNKNGVKTAAPLVANVFEYGSSKVDKQPFLRKSFKKAQIEKAMLHVQDKYIREV